MKIVETIDPSNTRWERRCMGGYVGFTSIGIVTDEPIFSQVEEVRRPGGAVRVVTMGSDLDTALRSKFKKYVGGEPFTVPAVQDGNRFTVEYKRGYSATKPGGAEEAPDGEDSEE